MSGQSRQQRGPHGPGHGMMPGEKARDFKGTLRKMIRYMGAYRYALIAVMVFTY